MENIRRFGRWAYFDTGIEYRFGREQSTKAILTFYGDYDKNSYDDQTYTSLISWNSDILEKLKYSLNLMSEDFPEDVDLEYFEASVEGTKKLQKFLDEDLRDFLHEKTCYFDGDDREEQMNNYANYTLGCIIYHQLTYTSKLTCHFNG